MLHNYLNKLHNSHIGENMRIKKGGCYLKQPPNSYFETNLEFINLNGFNLAVDWYNFDEITAIG